MPNYWSGDPVFGEIDNYITLFKAASAEIKSIDPTVPVLMAGEAVALMEFDDSGNPVPLPASAPVTRVNLNAKNLSNVEKFFTQACSSFDVADLHLYHTIPSIPQRIKWFKNVMAKTNCNKPIWTTEGSGPNPQDPEYVNLYTTDSQIATAAAADLPQRIKAQFAAGEDKVFYLPYKESSVDPIQEHLGLLDEQGIKKPAYDALKQLIRESALQNQSLQTSSSNATNQPILYVPTNLTVSQMTSRWNAQLYWNYIGPSTLPMLEIWRSGSNDQIFKYLGKVQNTTSYIDTTQLTIGKTYSYKVRSYIAKPDGTYAYSNFSNVAVVTIK